MREIVGLESKMYTAGDEAREKGVGCQWRVQKERRRVLLRMRLPLMNIKYVWGRRTDVDLDKKLWDEFVDSRIEKTLSCTDDKKCIPEDGISTLPWNIA